MKSKNSLLDITRKSLNDEQITDCFARFKEAVSNFTGLPQVELIDKIASDKHLKLQFISLSEAVDTPTIVIHATESCRNMETVKSIQVDAHSCGTCKGGSTATFTNKNINKFDEVLSNIQELFDKNYKEAMVKDKKEVEFNKVIDNVKTMLAYVETKDKKKDNWKYHHKMNNVWAKLEEDREDKTFDIKLMGLSIEQVRELAKVITSL